MKRTKNEWLSQYEGKVSERDYTLLGKAYDVLAENTVRYENAPWGDKSVISPWVGGSEGIWNWDSAFHAMTVCRFDTELAKDCINCFMQYQLPCGMLPDVIYADGSIMDNYSKPPVMAWAVLTVFEHDGDMSFLAENYKRLVAYERFWTRDRQDGGLFFYSAQNEPEKDGYLHPRWESGWDNSPRWDKPIVDFWAIDLNCFMVGYYRSMSKMAKVLGEDSAPWDIKERELSALIEEKLFDVGTGAYVDRNRRTGEYSSVLSPASFMPLFAGIASKEHIEAMEALAKDKSKFFPAMPTVAYDDPAFSTGYWRGQTWLNVAYFAAKGLKLCGCEDTANRIKQFLLDMVYDNIDRGIFENYDSVNRRGMYCESFSWSAAFVIEFILNW